MRSVPPVGTTAAWMAGAGAVGFVALLAALHVVRTDLDPSWHFISEYAIGRHGWLMGVAFLALSGSFVAHAVALRSQLRSVSGRIGQGLLLVSACGLLLAAVFTTDPLNTPRSETTTPGMLHNLGATLGIAMPFAVVTVTWVLLRRPAWVPARRRLIPATAATLAGFVVSFATLAMMTSDSGGTFGPDVHVGWPNRLEVVLYCVWLVTVAREAIHLAARPAVESR